MKIEQIYTGCLAQGAYYIHSEGEAVIIDPLREITPYLERAKKDNVKIKYILETHFHADFVSGHLDLAKATGGKIVYGPEAHPDFEFYSAKNGEILIVGKVSIQVLHTPGHTLESTCYLLRNENNQPVAVFTGDTLFIGDVGRPDLAQKSADMTQEQLAATLFHSLRNQLMTLPDEVIVYPGHGAGSACGKNMSKETFSTIGEQKQKNYALRIDMTEAEFVKEVTNGLAPPPNYFPQNVALNKKGYENLDSILSRAKKPLSPEVFEAIANQTNALILDTRKPQDFHKGFIPNSINIGLDGQLAPWVGALILDIQQPILLVTEVGKEEETIIRLSRVGYDNVQGFLENGFETWQKSGKEIDTIHRISAIELSKNLKKEKNSLIIDVRRESEYQNGHLQNAQLVPLDFINENLEQFPKNKHFYLHCAGGYRSMIAASILKSRGWENFTEIEGGFGAIAKTDLILS
jgi:glyoxylase-like metal-dependent hydrolase (beta-lactamase superfamily II)/rhodanese-related sulfurtransferase